MNSVYIVDAIRTPVGKAPRGVFRNTLPDELLVHLLKQMQQRHRNVDWEALGDVIIGCAMPEAEQGMNVARIATLLSGLPASVPAMTLNRFCSSGVQSIATAANAVAQGEYDLALAGGVESMSKVPLGGNKYTANPAIFNDEHIAIAYGMGITAEKVAQQWGISRQDQDAFAEQSHYRAILAQKEGAFEDEMIPFEVVSRTPDLKSGKIVHANHLVSQDEGPRANTSYETIAALKPVFSAQGSVTAGNSSQMSDGAGLVMLASEEALKTYQLEPLARLVGYAVAGVPPEVMGIGPVAAIPKALFKADLSLQEIEWIELNEAFAAQSLAVMQELGLPSDIVNPLGGAIALGHPLGATGAIRTATLLHGLKRHNLKYGMVTMCIGTGMGAAAIFERL